VPRLLRARPSVAIVTHPLRGRLARVRVRLPRRLADWLQVVDLLFSHVPLLHYAKDAKGRRRRMTLGQHMRDIVRWTARDGATTPYTLASRNDHWEVCQRLSMALLLDKVQGTSGGTTGYSRQEKKAKEKRKKKKRYSGEEIRSEEASCDALLITSRAGASRPLKYQVPYMDENKLILELEIYGISIDGCTLEQGRVKFLDFLKSSFGMDANPLPYFEGITSTTEPEPPDSR